MVHNMLVMDYLRTLYSDMLRNMMISIDTDPSQCERSLPSLSSLLATHHQQASSSAAFCMATTLSEEHERELKKIFDDYDQNGSGDIDVDELRDIAEDLGEPLSEVELKYLTKEFDSDQSGTISWTEFIAWWKLPF